jgi:hypothetical protein
MSTVNDNPLLVVGGSSDPNLHTLMAAAARQGLSAYPLLFGADSHPALTWEVASGQLLINGKPTKANAAFIRHDVFGALEGEEALAQYRALAWHTALTGWVSAHPEVRIFNRRNLNQMTNKPLVLHWAKSVGLTVPQTMVSNDFDYLARYEPERSLIVKPINGGGFCQDFREVGRQTALRNNRAAAPAIIQHRLVAPEVRVYVVGRQHFAFEVISDELDYRTTQNCRLTLLESIPESLVSGLRRLLDIMGLDFAAADFKTHAQSGELVFLEVNTAPMFAAFDKASGGRLCDGMIAHLTASTNANAKSV